MQIEIGWQKIRKRWANGMETWVSNGGSGKSGGMAASSMLARLVVCATNGLQKRYSSRARVKLQAAPQLFEIGAARYHSFYSYIKLPELWGSFRA